jgi:hypothetical protein
VAVGVLLKDGKGSLFRLEPKRVRLEDDPAGCLMILAGFAGLALGVTVSFYGGWLVGSLAFGAVHGLLVWLDATG